MATLLMIVTFLIIAWIEGMPLLRQGHRREAVIFGIVWLVSGVYATLIAAGISMPNPVEWLDFIFRPLLPLP